jgi:triphosphatase
MVPRSSPSTEVELKFQSSREGIAAISSDPMFEHKSTRSELRSVYYDTPGWDLRRAGISLRVRRKNGLFIQTVKRQSGLSLFESDEWESPIGGECPDSSAYAATPVASILREKSIHALCPIFTTTVQRTVRVVRKRRTLVEVSLDEGELRAGKLREPLEEVELELKGGDAAGLFGIARHLIKHDVLRLSFDSKADRGYRLIGHDGLTAHKANAVHITHDMAAMEGFTHVARSCLAHVSRNALLMRRARDPEVLHQLRVGLRRMRVAFAVFKPILDREILERFKDETAWLAGELDSARDLDVFIQSGSRSAKAEPHNDSHLAAFDERLLEARASAYDRALVAIDSHRFAVLLLDCAEWLTTKLSAQEVDLNNASPRNSEASVFAVKVLRRLYRKLRKSGRHLEKFTTSERHRVRIKAKKLQCAIEFFTATFGKNTRQRANFVASLDTLQNTLGQLNDMAIARTTALAVAGRSAHLAFHAGRLVGRRDQDEPRLLAQAAHAYGRWRRAKRFWR